jgi:hypothetical protein
VSVLRKIIPVVFVFIAVVGMFFLPVSTILLYDQPMSTAVQDSVRTATEKCETADFSSTDLDAFTNTEYVFFVPPAEMVAMSNFYYLNDCWWWNGDDNNGVSVMDGCRGNEYYHPIMNCSVIFISAYEREAHVQVEWLNATALRCYYDEYNGWQTETGAKVEWASDIPRLTDYNATLSPSWNYTVGEFNYLEIPVISVEIAPGWHVMSGTVRIRSDVPVTVMHHKLDPGAATDTDDEHYANAWWNSIWSGYGKKLMVRVAGDLWISALEAPTKVRVWDMSDRDDASTFELDTFEGWEYTRNPILQQEGFDDDIVLISADHPVSVVGGIESRHAFAQVYGKDGRDYLFPCFGKVLVHAPDGAQIFLEDRAGNQGSFEGTLKSGEMRVFDLKVLYKSRCYPSFEWAHLRANKPVYVYTIGDNPWTLDERYNQTIGDEDMLTVYKKTSILFEQGYKPYPASKDFTVPIRSRVYVTIQNLGKDDNQVNFRFSELSLPLEKTMPAYSSMTVEISENSYEYLDLEGQYQRETEAFWSNRNHPYVYRIVVDNNLKSTVYLSRDNITKGTTLSVKAEGEVMVFVDYNRDYQNYASGADLIPGLASPAPRGLPEAQPMIVALGGIVVAMDVIVVAGGGKSLIDRLWKWRA